MVVHRVEGADEEEEHKHAGVGIQLYGNGDDVLKTWNNFISEMANRKPATDDEDRTTVNLQAGYDAVNDEIQLNSPTKNSSQCTLVRYLLDTCSSPQITT